MLSLRAIRPEDNPAVARVIKTVMPEFNCVGEGFSLQDPEVESMYKTYAVPGAEFFILEADGPKIVGVGGYASLTGGDGTVCELRKMYILSEYRGQGGGKLLMERCLRGAKAAGYATVYLETVAAMTRAAEVYKSYGFEYINNHLGCTGHSGCDRFMIKDL